MKYKPPFPWFGGKAPVADVVWSRFGPVDNYVEPGRGKLSAMVSEKVEL